MEFLEGRPTYRLKYGAVGESHALAVAARPQERIGTQAEELPPDE